MGQRQQSAGECAYCGRILSKAGMTKHLPVCEKRQAVIAKAERAKVATIPLHHLRVRDEILPMFWLDLEVRGSATLSHLDSYLRAIWLECCGHLSQFSFGGWQGEELSMQERIDGIFTPGAELTHIYDFGTSSITLIKAVSVRSGKPTTSKPVALMARNVTPVWLCIECGQPAAWLCMECRYEHDSEGTLCDLHKESHPHDGYGEPLPLANSPRVGKCGYEGPAVPPY